MAGCVFPFDEDFDILRYCQDMVTTEKGFADFTNLLKLSTSKKYTFTLDPIKYETYKSVFGKINEKVPFEWEYIIAFGTDEQKQIFNEFRNKYISYIIRNFCATKENVSRGNANSSTKSCKYQVIGTPASSPESDMDFDLTDKDVGSIIQQITKLHKLHFSKNIDVIFDANLYGSVFDAHNQEKYNNPSTTLIAKQNAWSWTRTVEVMQNFLSDDHIDAFMASLLSVHKKMYKDAETKINEIILTELDKNTDTNSKTYTSKNANTFNSSQNVLISHKSLNNMIAKRHSNVLRRSASAPVIYARRLTDYFSEDNDEKKIDLFSKAKYFENETYRSLGAVLHIVNKQMNVSKVYYAHSIYDQYGFIVENILEQKIRGTSLDVTIPKTSKYIERVCDAIEKIGIHNLVRDFESIKTISTQLNAARRTSNSRDIVRQLTTQLKTVMDPSLLSNSNSRDNETKLTFLIAVYTTLLKPVGEYFVSIKSGGKIKKAKSKAPKRSKRKV